MSKILPQQQNLFPVAFKRKLSYEGHYIYEIIDKNKVEIWYQWLKRNNFLFQNIDLDSDAIDGFLESTRQMASEFEKQSSVNTHEPNDEFHKEPNEEIPIAKQYDAVISDKYDLSFETETIIDRFANMVVDFEIKFNIPKDEILADSIEDIFDDEDSSSYDEEEETREDNLPKTNQKEVHVAPGEAGKFKSWGSDIYLEESAFPSIFFTGQGGFISTNLKRKKPIGFAHYVRNRLRSICYV